MFQVETDHQSLADMLSGLALHIHETLFLFQESLIEIAVHVLADACDPGLRILLPQIDFRIDKIQCRRCSIDEIDDFLPVFRLGSKLVAGDNRPFFEVCTRFGKQDFRDAECDGFMRFHCHSFFSEFGSLDVDFRTSVYF